MRIKHDAYYTPTRLAKVLVNLLPIVEGARVLEPSLGQGAFADAIRLYTKDVYGVDIERNVLGEARCKYFAQADFLSDEHFLPSNSSEPTFDWIIGNPPFSHAEEHLRHACKHSKNVAFLMRLAILESAKRIPLWKEVRLKKVWVLVQRPSFTDGKTDSCAYGFFWCQQGWEYLPELDWVSWK